MAQRPLGSADSEPGRLRAVCLGCGLERTDQPLVEGGDLAICLACGDVRVVFDHTTPPRSDSVCDPPPRMTPGPRGNAAPRRVDPDVLS
jgi:hypothetical protein